MKRVDLTGLRYGRLTVTSRASKDGGPYLSGRSYWRCACDCGSTTVVAHGNLRSGSVKSCGCLRAETLDRTTHGLSSLSEYSVWSKMIRRCTDPKSPNWRHYGGRGIRVDKRWLDLKTFLEDMGPRPEGTTLGRIDNEGDYAPGNCRWETPEQQANNKRTTRRLTFNGRTQSLSQWARDAGMPVETLFARLKKMPIEDAIRGIVEK